MANIKWMHIIYVTRIMTDNSDNIPDGALTTGVVLSVSSAGANGARQKFINKFNGKRLADIVTKLKASGGYIKYGNFDVKGGKITGNGKVAVKTLTPTGGGKFVAIAQYKKTANTPVSGYLLADDNGMTGTVSREWVQKQLDMHGSAYVQNLKTVDKGGKEFVSAQDSLFEYVLSSMQTVSDHAQTEVKAIEENKPVALPQAAPKMSAKERADKVEMLKRKKMLEIVGNTKVGKRLNTQYSSAAMRYIITLAKARRKYDFLLNPAYSVEQMTILHKGYTDGVDITQFNDPKISASAMRAIHSHLKGGAWHPLFIAGRDF